MPRIDHQAPPTRESVQDADGNPTIGSDMPKFFLWLDLVERKVKTAASATTGALVGGLLAGPAWPLGALAGAAVAGYAGKVTARAGERRLQRKWEKQKINEFGAQGKGGVQREGVVFA